MTTWVFVVGFEEQSIFQSELFLEKLLQDVFEFCKGMFLLENVTSLKTSMFVAKAILLTYD